MANYVDQINLNGNVADMKGCDGDYYYPGVNLATKFASEIANYSDAWAWIKARITAGNFSKIHVGDWIPVSCSNGTNLNMAIMGINTYKGFGTQAVGNHIDFVSKSLWPTAFKYNLAKTNNGVSDCKSPWLSSNAYHFVNSLAGNVPNSASNQPEMVAVDYTESGIYYYLPDAVKNVIADKYIFAPERYSAVALQTDDNSMTWQSLGKLWLPSEVEIAGFPIWGSRGYGAMGFVQYPYFAHNMNRIANRSYSTWTMSVSSGETANAISAHGRGYLAHPDITNENRALVCFRVA